MPLSSPEGSALLSFSNCSFLLWYNRRRRLKLLSRFPRSPEKDSISPSKGRSRGRPWRVRLRQKDIC